MSQSLEETPLSKVKRGPNRASYDKDLALEIIDAALMCHVGQTKDGQVFVTPTSHWREGDYFYWHAHSKARNVKGPIDTPEKVCINVSLLDGLVLARSAMHHSVNYKEEKVRQFKLFLDKVSPGRWETLRPVNEQEIKATGLVRIKIDEASVKMRTEPPVDDPADNEWPVWAGVMPLERHWGKLQKDPIQNQDYPEPKAPNAV